MNYVIIIFLSFTAGYFIGWQHHKEFSESLGVKYENTAKFDEPVKH